MRDGVDNLVLVGPPVREAGTSSTVCGNFVGHLVALENMLKCPDPDTELLHGANKGEDFILPV